MSALFLWIKLKSVPHLHTGKLNRSKYVDVAIIVVRRKITQLVCFAMNLYCSSCLIWLVGFSPETRWEDREIEKLIYIYIYIYINLSLYIYVYKYINTYV